MSDPTNDLDFQCHTTSFFLFVQWSETLKQKFTGRRVVPLRHIIWFRANQSLFLLFHAACLAKKHQFYSLWFDPTGEVEPTIYHTLGEYANHYTTDAVLSSWRYHQFTFPPLSNFKNTYLKIHYIRIRRNHWSTLVSKWRLPKQHLICTNTQGPPVNLYTISTVTAVVIHRGQ